MILANVALNILSFMPSRIIRWRSLNTRITVFTLAIFLAGLWALAFFAAQILRGDMLRQVGEQQFAAVSLIAAQLDEHLEDRLVTLHGLANSLDPALLADRAALQTHLDRHFPPPSLFSGGLFVTDARGIALAELPTGTGRTGIDFSDRDAVAAALRGTPSVGEPVIGHMPKVPVFGVAVPLRNGEQVIGALVGAIALDRSGFLDQITKSRYGESGGYFLVSVPQRLIITSTHRNRIMQPLAPPGKVPAIDRFLEGFEGSAVYTNQMGVEVLNSSKRLKNVAWGVSASIQTTEAFAPIREMQQKMLLMTLGLSLLAGLATTWMLRHELLPVREAAEILARAPVSGVPQPLPVRRADEVGALITRFNQLLTQLGEREQAMIRSESKFRSLFDSTQDAVLMLDERGFIDCNPAALGMFGCATREEFCTFHPADLSPPTQASGRSSRELAEAHIQTAITEGHVRFDWIHRRADTGETFDAEVLLNAIQIEGRLLLQATCRDISERKQAEQALAEQEQLWRSIVATSPDGIMIASLEGVIHYASEKLIAMTGYESAEELVGRNMIEFTDPSFHAKAAERIGLMIQGTYTGAAEYLIIRKDGSRMWMEANAEILRDTDGSPRSLFVIERDIADRKQAEAELEKYRYQLESANAQLSEREQQLTVQLNEIQELQARLQDQAIRDGLTGLFNRRYLDETLLRELARAKRDGYPLAVIMIDIDHFKQINDTYGHPAGDEVIKSLGAVFKQGAREGDIACRYGGEEFVIALPHMEVDAALARAEKWRSDVEFILVKHGDLEMRFTISSGVSAFPGHAAEHERLIECADLALYKAKNDGRNRVTCFESPDEAG